MKKSQNIMSMIVDKPCFQQSMAYGNFKDSDKILRYKVFNIAKNQKYDEISKRSCFNGL